MALHRHPALGEDRVAVPAHRIPLHIERDGQVIGVPLDQKARQHRSAGAEPQVRLLQADDIGTHLVQHIENPHRIALAVCADTLVDVVASDLEAARHALRPQPAASRLALPPAAVVSMQVTRSVAKRAR